MRCPIETHGNAELLLDYSTRKLNPELSAVLEAHMDICPACREFRDGQRAMWDALDWSWKIIALVAFARMLWLCIGLLRIRGAFRRGCVLGRHRY